MYVLGLRVVWRIRRRPEGGRDEGPQARHYASTQSPQAGRGGPRVLLGNAQQRASRNGDRGPGDGLSGALSRLDYPGSGAPGGRILRFNPGFSADTRADLGFGRIAQLAEHLPYKQGVTGSSPVSPTICESIGVSFSYMGIRVARSG